MQRDVNAKMKTIDAESVMQSERHDDPLKRLATSAKRQSAKKRPKFLSQTPMVSKLQMRSEHVSSQAQMQLGRNHLNTQRQSIIYNSARALPAPFMPPMGLEQISETPQRNPRYNQSMDESIVEYNDNMLEVRIDSDDDSIQQEQRGDRPIRSERGAC